MCTIWWKRANETNIQLSWSGNNSISYNQSPSKYVCVLHPRSKVSKVLSTSIVRLIQLSFPAILAGLNWKLIYCGCSRDRARWLKTRLVDSQRQLIWRNSRWTPPPPSSQRKRYSSSDWSSTQALALFFSSSSSSCLFREPLLTRAHKD